MKRLLLLLYLLLMPAFAAQAQPALRTIALTDGSGPAAVTIRLSFYAASPGIADASASMIVSTNNDVASLDVAGPAIDRLLGQLSARRELPSKFIVLFGTIREPIVAELQRRLRLAGANWNLKTGRPRNGDYATVLQGILASIVDESAVAAAFRHHGYLLRLDEIARLTRDDTLPRSLGLVPTHVDEMYFSAHRTPH